MDLDTGTEVDGGAWSSSCGSGVGNSPIGWLHTKLTPSPACWSIHCGGSAARRRRPWLTKLVGPDAASSSAVERGRGEHDRA
jgi:hypothetical protein